MSLKASYSSENLMLPVSDPPNDEDLERLLKDNDKIFRGSAITKPGRGVFAAVSYMSCAVLLVMFNKAALSSYNFPSANVITLLQVDPCKAGEAVIIADNSKKFVPLKTLKHTFPLAGAYLLYMLVTMESVRGVNVPMYTTLRRTTVVFTMLVEYMLVGQRYTPPVIFSVGLIVFGAFVAGARDLSFDAYGYAIVFLSNITTTIYLATISRVGKTSGLNSFGLMWCNGVICGPLLLIWTLIRGDLKMTINFPHLLLPGFIVVMLFSCIIAFFLNYSIFLNTTLNSALTQTICGNMKRASIMNWKLIVDIDADERVGERDGVTLTTDQTWKLGLRKFQTTYCVLRVWNVIGQLLGFAGSGLYAYYKLIGK
ncbi:Sugar phosphate transporter domain [Sesbania bispinosa]|nr:Sugar phosphate transporter domain [Sesbania bispinosa]